MPEDTAYDERLGVPLRWWALATMFLASVLVAFLVATPLWVALSGTAVLSALVAGVFVSYGSAHVTVGGGMLRAGRARISLTHLGQCQALDAEATRRLAGRDADARAYLLIRPYLRAGVRVDIADPGDPAPYWLLASRRPARLVAALQAAGVQAAGVHHPVRGGYDDHGSAPTRTDTEGDT
jgi:hypothetical protein